MGGYGPPIRLKLDLYQNGGAVLYIGVDPGVNGAIAAVGHAAGVVTEKMPATDADVLYIFQDLKAVDVTAVAVLEKIWAMPHSKRGTVGSFKLGASYGALRMALAASGIVYDEVSPQRWQGAMGCRSGGDKNVTKARAQALFPDVKVTHAIADALLLAEYCRRVRSGELALPVAKPKVSRRKGPVQTDLF